MFRESRMKVVPFAKGNTGYLVRFTRWTSQTLLRWLKLPLKPHAFFREFHSSCLVVIITFIDIAYPTMQPQDDAPSSLGAQGHPLRQAIDDRTEPNAECSKFIQPLTLPSPAIQTSPPRFRPSRPSPTAQFTLNIHSSAHAGQESRHVPLPSIPVAAPEVVSSWVQHTRQCFFPRFP